MDEIYADRPILGQVAQVFSEEIIQISQYRLVTVHAHTDRQSKDII